MRLGKVMGQDQKAFGAMKSLRSVGDPLKGLGRSVTGLLLHENVVILSRNSVFVEYVMVTECTFRFP